MYGSFSNIRIAGIQSVVPKTIVSNNSSELLSKGSVSSKFIHRTGILERRMVKEGQSATDLSTVAAEQLLSNLKWNRDEIRIIVNVSRSTDLRSPSMAMILQKRLAIGTDCLAFDVNLGCSAYVSGLQIISSILQNTGGKGLLLVGYGMYHNIRSESHHSLLFGHASSATAIELEDNNPLLYSQNTDGSRFNYLYVPNNKDAVMDGNAILLFAMNEVCNSINEFKRHYKIDENSIDYYILHQAQRIVVDSVIDGCPLSGSKVLTSYEKFGNTNTTSIPLTITINRESFMDKKRVHLLMSGFGSGLTWSNVYTSIDPSSVYPLIESDKTFGDLPND